MATAQLVCCQWITASLGHVRHGNIYPVPTKPVTRAPLSLRAPKSAPGTTITFFIWEPADELKNSYTRYQ